MIDFTKYLSKEPKPEQNVKAAPIVGRRTYRNRKGEVVYQKATECEMEYDPATDTLSVTKGCVTGYESIYLHNHDNLQFMLIKGWYACAGTNGSWDELYFAPEDLKSAFQTLGVIPS